jgi:hypothetical protein
MRRQPLTGPGARRAERSGVGQGRFVFVGGLHRSGTTLLAKTLGAHPAVTGLSGTGVVEDEGQFLQSVYPPDSIHGGAGRFGFDARAHLTENSPLATPENALRLRGEWAPYLGRGEGWLLEKSPSNLLRARFLQVLFPDARFVFVLRHPVAVSLATRKWSRTGVYALIHHWLRCHELLREDLPALGQALVLSYEAFVAAPEATLARIQAFLELEEAVPTPALRRDVNASYFGAWREAYGVRQRRRDTEDFDPRFPPPVPDVKERLRGAVVRRCIRLLEDGFGRGRYNVALAGREAQDAVESFEARVNGFGYSLLDLDRRPAGELWRRGAPVPDGEGSGPTAARSAEPSVA